MKGTRVISAGLLAMLALSACGKQEAVTNVAPQSKDDEFAKQKVTLKLFSHSAGINTEQDVNDLILKPIQAKYPNISVELITGKKLEELPAAGEIPDLLFTSNYYMIDPLELGLASDLRDSIKTLGLDLNKFEPQTVKVIQNFGKNGEIYGVPFSMNYGIMAYNKDIFDKFGVEYPKDNMTWNQVIELSKRVTRLDADAQYVGIDPGPALALSRAYSLPLLDAKQEKAALTTDGFQKVFQQAKQIFDIPGIVDPNKKYSYGVGFFLKDKKLAMYPYWLSAFASSLSAADQPGKLFNWDMVTYPQYDDRPGIGREVDFHLMMIPSASKNKEAAYRVIEVLASEEAQKTMNKGARMTALKDPNLRKQFASDMKVFEGKNLDGIFKVNPAPLPPASKYDVKIYGFLNDALKSVIVDGTDINTALRTANEKADKLIQEMNGK
ncbi:ABC transporter substrate-binding protein [Paenibacillus ginsengarvi]|uniref:Carbohydrate ABC transporter substrate-binding protein n=1 Tax=Paenibacillus ginsengarvi TaxID=400777 RepID=A0A3B0CZ99_9BACL|nr:ABC transporter substrate-binding protein [Paenibacillus ginsengarvi]RKN86856.1 carbohydrate ABC transporter substrate-binding protein [Paenibacillus ginsengarvi]